MVMAVERVAETVAFTHRPSYHQTSVYSQYEVAGQQRYKQEVKFQPVLKPVKYTDTAFLQLNNTFKRYRSRTYYQPRLQQRSYADTTYATPKTTQEKFVSFLDLHTDQLRKQFKTIIEIKPLKCKFKSSISYPNIESLPSSNSTTTISSTSTATNPHILTNGYCCDDVMNVSSSSDLDENMNRRIPVFKEQYDPGASQVFIPKRREFSENSLLDSISDQIIIDFPQQNGRFNGYSSVNGHGANSHNGVLNGVSEF